jgi:hypothetical protein
MLQFPHVLLSIPQPGTRGHLHDLFHPHSTPNFLRRRLLRHPDLRNDLRNILGDPQAKPLRFLAQEQGEYEQEQF